MRMIYVEVVLLESLNSPTSRERLTRFNDAKIALYNQTMQQLNLQYRFKWSLHHPDNFENHDILPDLPPSSEWWETSCTFLSYPAIISKCNWTAFCDFDTKYFENWSLICYVYSFGQKYHGVEYDRVKTHRDFDFWNRVSEKFGEIRKKVSQVMTVEQYQTYFESVRVELEQLGEIAEMYRKVIPERPKFEMRLHRAKIQFRILRRKPYNRLLAFGQDVYIRVFEPWKLRKPLIHTVISVAEGSLAHQIL
jgi:hypothetical protein